MLGRDLDRIQGDRARDEDESAEQTNLRNQMSHWLCCHHEITSNSSSSSGLMGS